MTKQQIKSELRALIPQMERVEEFAGDLAYMSVYLGTFMALDPCGRYHHMRSPNGITAKCERFWKRLDRAAEELDCWIMSGEDAPCDIYLCKALDE